MTKAAKWVMNSSQVKEGEGHEINSKELGSMYIQCLKGSNFKGLTKDKTECQPQNKFQGMRQLVHTGQYLSFFFNLIFGNHIARFSKACVKTSAVRKIRVVVVESTYILKN